jgi:hypothetical protein
MSYRDRPTIQTYSAGGAGPFLSPPVPKILSCSGTLWEGRYYRATVVDSERYLLMLMRSTRRAWAWSRTPGITSREGKFRFDRTR